MLLPSLETLAARDGAYTFGLLEQLQAELGVTRFDDEHAMHAFAQSLVDEVNVCEIRGRTLSVSVGVSKLRHGDTQESLLKRADTAMYEAKRSGKNRYDFEQ